MCDPPLCFFLVLVGVGLSFLLGVAAGAEVEGDAGVVVVEGPVVVHENGGPGCDLIVTG